MKYPFLSLVENPPPGFSFEPPLSKHDVRSGPFALYSHSLQAAELRLKELGGSFAGVIVTDSDDYVWRPRAFPLFHLGIPPSLRPHLSVLLPSFLELLEAIQFCGDENRRYSLELGRTAEDRQRVEKDFAQSRKSLLDEITERKKFQERYQELFENATDIIYTLDLAGNFTSINKAAEKATGYMLDEALKINMDSIVAPEYLELTREMTSRKITGGGHTRFELEIVRKDGHRVPLEVGSRLIFEGGKPVGIQGIARDITERKRAEEEKLSLERQVQQSQKMESLGVLAGGIAHDFNNLLMVVLGHAELALKEISPMSPARRNLEEITTATQRAADLSRQMLAYAGKASFALERVGLRDLVEEMADLLKTTISKKAILTLNLERGLPPIEADPSQIRQIVINLIINASEAIGDRSGVITVSVGATRCDEEYLQKTELHDGLPPGLYVHLEVTDTGGGMDAETQSRIFEPFFSTKFTGRGLGLAAVLGIIRAYKGAMKVYSEPGKGTTFKILFPALTDGGDAIRPPDSSARSDLRGQGTILLVDDEESLLALGARMLEHLGFSVLTAADGLQAVDIYRERGKEIDLVLMDLTMPHMDGAEALGELRRLNPEVRVVLASGYGHDDVASRFEGKRLDGVLQKPYTLANLREALAGLMQA
ncbi:MAG: hybrid sensor histidine kinase/response regulator [Desulfobacteria bacterium]